MCTPPTTAGLSCKWGVNPIRLPLTLGLEFPYGYLDNDTLGDRRMKISGLLFIIFFSISAVAYGAPPSEAPLKPYPRLLPFQLVAPSTVQAGIPFDGVSISLNNPGQAAPDARLRLIIHEQVHGHAGAQHGLSPDNVKIEVLQNGTWVPVVLGVADESVMGVIGPEGVTAHRKRYGRGGFAIPPGLNKTWQLRMTFSLPGTYSLVAAVSPDNGSRHLAQPAHSIIDVQ